MSYTIQKTNRPYTSVPESAWRTVSSPRTAQGALRVLRQLKREQRAGGTNTWAFNLRVLSPTGHEMRAEDLEHAAVSYKRNPMGDTWQITHAGQTNANPGRRRRGVKRNPHAKPTPNLRVVGTRWRDSYGNTYHKAYIYIDGDLVGVTPITYGYGYHFEETAKEWLRDHGYHVPKRISGEAQDVRRKKDL